MAEQSTRSDCQARDRSADRTEADFLERRCRSVCFFYAETLEADRHLSATFHPTEECDQSEAYLCSSRTRLRLKARGGSGAREATGTEGRVQRSLRAPLQE